jgi:ubiquitin
MPVTVSVTYRAPKVDSKVVELFGRTFFDGKAVEIEDNEENQHAIAKLTRNKFFQVVKAAVAKRQARAEPEPDPEPVPEPEPIEEEPEPIKRAPAQQKAPKRNAPWLKRKKR